MLEHGPLMIAGALLFLTGLMMFSTGLLGRGADAHVLRKPGPPHLRGARDPDAARIACGG